MPSPLIGSRLLQNNPSAEIFHEDGLKAALDGNFADARYNFDTALQIVSELPQTIDAVIQGARITRDKGFTDLRESNELNDDPALLDRAQAIIRSSIDASAPIVNSSLDLRNAKYGVSRRKALIEARTEHGATVSLLGRIATTKQVRLIQGGEGASGLAEVAAKDGRAAYTSAHNFLLQGNNGYYLVSNSMVAARHELINGGKSQMLLWLGRADRGLLWTSVRDPRNILPAVLTAGSRSRDIISFDAAIKSLKKRP